MRTREGAWVTQPERLAAIAPGTPMWKAVPPRLVGPYLTGQRTVLAGYVYRAQDVRFHNPAEAYLALSLGWEDSEFTPHMSEIYLVAWLAGRSTATCPPAATVSPSSTSSRSRYLPGRACAVLARTGISLWPAMTGWPGRRRSRKPCDTGSWPPISVSPTARASVPTAMRRRCSSGPTAGGARLHGCGRSLAQAGQRHRPRRAMAVTPGRRVPRRALPGPRRRRRPAAHRLPGPRFGPGQAARLLGNRPGGLRGRGGPAGNHRAHRGAGGVPAGLGLVPAVEQRPDPSNRRAATGSAGPPGSGSAGSWRAASLRHREDKPAAGRAAAGSAPGGGGGRIRGGGSRVEYAGPGRGLARLARDRTLVRTPAGPSD